MNNSIKNGASPLQLNDLMLLLQCGDLENAMVADMITRAKEAYVRARHSQAITQMHSSNKYKDGLWKTYVLKNGKRKEVLRKTKYEIFVFLYDFYKAEEDASVTFEEAFIRLMRKKEDQLGRSHSTILDDSRYFFYLSKKLKNTMLTDVTEEDLRIWLVKSYMPTKPKEAALRKMLQILKQVFSYGISQKLCSYNPAQYILFDDYVKGCDLQKKQAEEREFSEAECAALRRDALKHISNPRSVMRLFAMETGLRAGELSALQWSDVLDDFVHVHRQQILDKSSGHQQFFDVPYTKDERKHPHGGRYVPRTEKLNEVLEYAKALSGSSKYVFHDKDGKPITKDSYMQNLRRACEKLGFDTKNNHAFRIAFNSTLIEKGLSSADRALILGHAVQTNEHHYSVSDRRRLEGIRQKMK